MKRKRPTNRRPPKPRSSTSGWYRILGRVKPLWDQHSDWINDRGLVRHASCPLGFLTSFSWDKIGEEHEAMGHGFRVGAWHVEPRANRVRGPGGDRRVPPKAMQVPVHLAERAEAGTGPPTGSPNGGRGPPVSTTPCSGWRGRDQTTRCILPMSPSSRPSPPLRQRRRLTELVEGMGLSCGC